MNVFWVLIKRELKSIRKEKTIMFAILIQLFIASFSSLMLMGIMSFYDPTSIGENTPVSVTLGVVGDADSPILSFVEEKENISVVPYYGVEEAQAAFQSGEIDAIMSIPENSGGVVEMDLFLPMSDTKSTIILMSLNDPLRKAEDYLRQENGISLSYANIEGKAHTSYEFLYSIIVPLLMFFPALIAGSIVIDTVSEELEHKTLDTLWAAPVSLNDIFSSKILAAILTAVIQCVLWMILLRFNTFPVDNFGLVLVLSVFIAGCISFGAAIIGVCLKDRERAQFVYSIALLLAAGIGYLLSPSPFSLITGLAVDNPFVGVSQVILYVVPVVGIGAAFFFLVSRRLVAVAY